MWYATSPANYRNDSIEERVSAGSLEEVLEAYQQTEGGIWVSAEYANEQLQSGNSSSAIDFDERGNAHVVAAALETDGRYMGTPFFMRSRPYVYQVGA